MPDGGAISVEMVFGRKGNHTGGPRWFSFVVREGSGPGGRLWGVAGATDMFAEWRAMRAGGEIVSSSRGEHRLSRENGLSPR